MRKEIRWNVNCGLINLTSFYVVKVMFLQKVKKEMYIRDNGFFPDKYDMFVACWTYHLHNKRVLTIHLLLIAQF